MAQRQTPPPERIPLVYRMVGETHVFTADGFVGFYVGSSNLSNAFNQLAPALSDHVSTALGCQLSYSMESPFADFESHLKSAATTGNFVMAHRANTSGRLESIQ